MIKRSYPNDFEFRNIKISPNNQHKNRAKLSKPTSLQYSKSI